MSLGFSILVSCAHQPPPPAPQKVAVAPPVAPPPRPAPRPRVFPIPEHKPTPPVDGASGSDAQNETLAMVGPESTMRPPETAVPPPQPSKLIGLDQPAATHLFGAATEQSEAPPATVWRYRNASCELDLFFYLDLRSGRMRTLHYTFKGDAVDPAQQKVCLQSLVVAGKS